MRLDLPTFERPANATQIHSRLARGDIYVHMVVVPEGYTLFDIAQTEAVVDRLPTPPEGYEIVRVDVVVRLKRIGG